MLMRREAWKEEALDDIFLERTREGRRCSDIGTVSKATLGKLLRDGVERIRAFLSA